MHDVKYLIIGGGIAGTSAAETLREQDPDSRIVIISDEPHPLYSRVLLTKPNFFLEKIPFDKIWLKKDLWYDERRIELWRGRTAVKLDPQHKVITLDNSEELRYEKLLLSIGGKVRKLGVAGEDKHGVFNLRTIDDTQAIIGAVKQAKVGVVVGGGIIGFEMAEMLEMAGLDTTFILRMAHYREELLGLECSVLVEERMAKLGVKLECSNQVKEILGEDKVRAVILQDGRELPCDIVIVGIGTDVSAGWLKNAGVEVNHGVVTNEFLETNLPDIYSAGDGTEFFDVIIGEKVMYANWPHAQKQGARAALNMAGEREAFRSVTFFQTHGFGIVMTYVGDVRPVSSAAAGSEVQAREIIQRGHEGDDIQERLFLKNNKLVGALLFNAPQHMMLYSKIIERQEDLTAYKKKLKDAHWEMNELKE